MMVILRVWQLVEFSPDYDNWEIVNQQYFLREDIEKAQTLAMELNRYFSSVYDGIYRADVVEV